MKYLKIYLFCLSPMITFSQNTVATIFIDEDKVSDSYSLFYPSFQSSAFLVDNCGQLINEWTDTEDSGPGSFILDIDGGLIRSKRNNVLAPNFFGASGAAGVIEKMSWDNELIWRHIVSDTIYRQHHDFDLMPNGNILYTAWQRWFMEDIILMGMDTSNYTNQEIWLDGIFEYDPNKDSIVWQWSIYDHLIQDYDPTKMFYGVVEDNPQLIDINYLKDIGNSRDFAHFNSISYNETLDQIVVSSKNFNEIWIIDHSTTQSEAAGHVGGNQNQGGDLLHRWGNPEAYRKGTVVDQRLFNQHNAKWIIDSNSIYFGDILAYNNTVEENVSLGIIYDTPMDVMGSYTQTDGKFLPEEAIRSISHPDTIKNYSTSGSTITYLDNGNFMMFSANQSRAFELTTDEELVWEYQIPLLQGEPVPQGTEIEISGHFCFKFLKYPIGFIGFEDKNLDPQAYLELEPTEDFCILSSSSDISTTNFEVYPNPVSDILNIQLNEKNEDVYEVLNVYGQHLLSLKTFGELSEFNLSSLQNGLYFIKRKGSDRILERIVKVD